jgi:hypothetical protein
VIVPGDVLDWPFGINREPCEALLIEITHTYPDGAMSVRWRHADNPRGVDWRGFIPADDIPPVLRHVEDFDRETRSMLPGGAL